MHLLRHLAEVNQCELLYMTKSLPCNYEFFCQQSFNAKSSPVLDGNSYAGKLISHAEVSFFKEPVESAALGHIDCVHRSVTQTKDFATLETNNKPGQFLLASWHFSCLYIKCVLCSIGEHIVHFQVPCHRHHRSFLEQ